MLKSRGFWIGMAVTAIFVGWFVWKNWSKFPDMKRAFEQADWRLALLALPIYFAGLLVRTMRWQYLLRPVKKVSTLRLYPVVIIGLMANNILPARAGELARAYVLGQREQISKTTSLGTIAVDRLFDGVTLIPLMLIVAAVAGDKAHFPVLGHDLNFAGLGVVMAILFGIALGALFYLALADSGRRLLHRMVHRFAPAKVKPHVEGLLLSFFEGLHALRSPIDLGIAWVMSLVSWLLEAHDVLRRRPRLRHPPRLRRLPADDRRSEPGDRHRRDAGRRRRVRARRLEDDHRLRRIGGRRRQHTEGRRCLRHRPARAAAGADRRHRAGADVVDGPELQ